MDLPVADVRTRGMESRKRSMFLMAYLGPMDRRFFDLGPSLFRTMDPNDEYVVCRISVVNDRIVCEERITCHR